MPTYATLKDMGIQNPGEIDRYSHHANDHTDYLRIVYRRKKGSLLPESRRYKFPRVVKTVVVDSGTRETGTHSESSQYLKSALAELDAIVSKQDDADTIRQTLNEEVALLEEAMAERIAQIKSLIDRLE